MTSGKLLDKTTEDEDTTQVQEKGVYGNRKEKGDCAKTGIGDRQLSGTIMRSWKRGQEVNGTSKHPNGLLLLLRGKRQEEQEDGDLKKIP